MSTAHRLAILAIGFALVGAAAEPAPAQSRPAVDASAQPAMQRGSVESPRSFFFKHLIIDAMWVPTESGSRSLGLIGGHLAIANIGRIYLNGPPGVIVMRTDGRVQTAYTWGFSFQVTEFSVPGTQRRAVLFVSLAKCWTFGDQRNGRNVGGLSIGWKR